MKKKKLIMTILQLALIIGFAYSFYAYVQNEIKPTTVYIYARTISDVNTQIQKEDIKAVTIPASVVTSDFLRNEKDIVGKCVNTMVFDGQYISQRQLVEKENIDVFASADLSQYRKISLPISYLEGFSGNIKRGDVVDLLFAGEGKTADDTGKETQFTYARTFLQNILVYSVNTKDGFSFTDHSKSEYLTSNDLEGNQLDVSSTSDELAVITLSVTLQQAEEINARINKGKISFLGRFGDSVDYETLGFVIGDYGKIFTGNANAETGVVELVEDTTVEAPKK